MEQENMNVEVQAVHFDMTDEQRELLDRKLSKLDFARELIIDLEFHFKLEKHEYEMDVEVHFRWGKKHAVKVKAFEFNEGVDRLIGKLEKKVRREKEKVKEH
jgi:putative sigma-54 modulation protein